MKKMIKFLLLLALACSVGMIYTIVNFGQLLEDTDFSEDDDE